MNSGNYKFLKLLAKQYPDIASASAEIIKLKAILNLPKGTEHFMSDLHGEYEAFTHILKNGSGVIRKKIDEKFGNTITEKERAKLATLIYYPEKRLRLLRDECDDMDDVYRITIYRLVDVCRYIASKYTRTEVRNAMPGEYAYILDELLNIPSDGDNKQDYYSEIVNSIITTECSEDIIIALSHLISHLCIHRLHIVGDIYDRGPGAEIIMDTLCDYHSVDIQWGNHDILWMGAACGNDACIANVIRMCTRYNNTDTLEVGYGISLRHVAAFASETYRHDPCLNFIPTDLNSRGDLDAIAKINKAITVIQLKLEGQIIKRNPHFNMQDRAFLDKIDFENKKVVIDGNSYSLTDANFPTIDINNPYELSAQEKSVMKKMHSLFAHSQRLHKHIRFLYDNGAMYTTFNGNLLYHGCIPLDKNGEFLSISTPDGNVCGKKLVDYCDRMARKAYRGKDNSDAVDFMWYLWCGCASPLFGKNKMTTFERAFTAEKELYTENKNPYYKFYNDEKTCIKILKEFGLDENNSHIINGHVPVRISKGESPIKGNGKLLVIDGGLSKPYHAQTGIAGYTLIYNSYGLHLVTHEPFESITSAIEQEKDLHSVSDFIEKTPTRLYISDTDQGKLISEKIQDLNNLIMAYRNGSLA